jgi:hypothetical protein
MSPDSGLGDELFSLTARDLLCYEYGMDNRQDAAHLPYSPEIRSTLGSSRKQFLTEQNYPW